jgi:hypothetical protein
MTTTATPANQTVVTHTIGLSTGPLASDTNLVAGREGTAIDNNATDQAIDAVLGGFITTGTSPTASKQIEVWVSGSYDGTSYAGGATGSDANLTPQAKSLLKLGQVIPTTSTSNQKYTFCVGSVAALFGGAMPRKWSVFVVHNTGVALNSTAGNHEIKHTPIKYQSA